MTLTLSLSASTAKSTLPRQTSPRTLPGDADDEQVVEALAEDHLRRHPGVRAADHDRERRLLGYPALLPRHPDLEPVALDDVPSAPRRCVSVVALAARHPAREHPVAILEVLPRHLGVRRRRLRAGVLGIEPIDIINRIHRRTPLDGLGTGRADCDSRRSRHRRRGPARSGRSRSLRIASLVAI